MLLISLLDWFYNASALLSSEHILWLANQNLTGNVGNTCTSRSKLPLAGEHPELIWHKACITMVSASTFVDITIKSI